MSARNVKLNVLLAVAMVLGLLFAAAPGRAMAAGDIPTTIQTGADRLTEMQRVDGGWGWPLTYPEGTASAPNTIGPIGKGLAFAYLHTGDLDHKAALEDVGAFLLTKSHNFSVTDGYLAAQLDDLLDTTIYSAHVVNGFFAPLAAGTYTRLNDATLYTTASFVNRIRTVRAGDQANMAAWDIGMGIVGAAAVGADTGPWISGTKAEIDELNGSAYYDVIGLAGALYGLAYVGEEFDPTAGEHMAASSLADLAAILASYQLTSGGFTWSSTALDAGTDEAMQETAYAILALDEIDRSTNLTTIAKAASYLLGAQLPTGGWGDTGENNEVTGEVLWAITEAMGDWWVCPTGNCGYPGFQFATISAAIAAASDGDTIHVAAGSFTGPITINKDITLIGENAPDGTDDSIINGLVTVTADGATVQNLKIVPGSGLGQAAGISVFASNVTVTGNWVDGMTGNGTASIKGIHVYSSPAVISNILISNNKVSNIVNTGRGADGIMVQGSVSGVDVLNNTVDTITSAGWAYGIEVTPSGGSPSISPLDVLIQGNTIDTVNNIPLTATAPWPGAGVSIDIAGSTPADATQVMVIENSFLNVPYPLNNKDTAHTLNASPNWFGSSAGPAIDSVLGEVNYAPWCADSTCTTFYPTADHKIDIPEALTADFVQQFLANAPEGSNILIPAGAYDKVGGFVINTPHLTILVGSNAHINNHSSCFDIQASYTIIKAEVSGEAFCNPTETNHGFAVDAGLTDVTIQGFDIEGSLTTGNAINFAGDITNFQIVENNIHDFSGSGIVFSGDVINNQGIQGNLFKNIADGEIVSSVPVEAQFNNWDSKIGVTLTNVTSSDWTYAGLKVTSSGTPWANQVVSGQTITYTVKADLVNVTGADFTLEYPANLTLVTPTPIVMGGTFTSESVDTTVHGKLTFIGVNLSPATPETGDDIVLFSATFTAGATGLGALTFDPATDGFGMAPTTPVAPSNMVYTNVLNNGTVNVITLPTLSWVDAFPTYAAGFPQEFKLIINNPLAGGEYTGTAFNFALPAGATLKYWDGDSFEPQIGNFVIGALANSGTDVEFRFQITFASSGSASTTVALLDTVASTTLASVMQESTVNANFTVTGTISMQGRTFRGGVPVLLTNLGLEPYGPFPGTTTTFFTDNLVITNVAMETYRFTTNQPRYLDVIATNSKQIVVDGNKTLAALELKGGDVNDDNVIGGGDASIVGTQYGTPGTGEFNGDANFSGKVDIFDLALVGGNYLLNSETAYGVGINIWVP